DEDKTIASFVGFAPADDPKFAMLVKLEAPTSSPWAADTAAPLWMLLARRLLLYYGIAPDR
ncbi:MAG: penicillin-binding protein 2, partial [Candidatus Chisholmbacteria bacterium]|nr:penicillin-binding protein 2 [Candidatus Chisholmbacteria bacterium]